jgi:predicted neuraminidase
MSAPRSQRRRAAALLGVGLLAAAWRMPQALPPRFVVPPIMPAAQRAPLPAEFQWRLAPQPTPSAHACSLAVAPDGALLVAWFGGEAEGAGDVAIHMVRWPQPDSASAPLQEAPPWVSLDRERLQALTSRVIRKIGNPVLWFDGAGRLHMHVVSVSYGGWSGSAINQLVSDDEGHSWREARRLVTSPFLNLSTLVRTQPQLLEDGTVGLPAYHEFVQKWGLWLRVTDDGHVLASAPMQRYEGGWLQPAVAAISPQDAVAALRCAGRTHHVGWSATRDGGESWPLRPSRSALDVPNPDSSVAMIRLSDGTLLMACNPLESGRHRLQLFRSGDEGATWQASKVIETSDDGADEFSYPALVQDRQARIHLGYTWKRKGIAVCTFSPEWLDTVDDGKPAVDGSKAALQQPSITPAAPSASTLSAPGAEVSP